MKRLCTLTVRGHEHTWAFETEADPKYLEEWRADGVEIYEIANTIPEWVVDSGLTRVWCFGQDLFNFRNPFK